MSINFRFGRFELRPDERALLSDGAPLRLGGRAFDILLALVQRRDRLVEIDELLDVVWPGLAVEENNLSVQISTLRKLLGNDAIATVRGRGYRFTVPARESNGAVESAPALASRLARHVEGALVAVEVPQAGHARDAFLDELGGRVLRRTDRSICLAFERTRDAARAALTIQRRGASGGAGSTAKPAWHARSGMVRADITRDAAPELQHSEELALALADSAGVDEIVVTGDLVAEFIPDIDGDVEDLGELLLAGEPVRAYRVRATAASAAVAVFPQAGETGVKPGIAVLPFDALSTDKAEDMLGEALADDVIASLSRNLDFSVISGLSSRRLKRSGLSPASAGAWLSASFLLTGSYKSVDAGLSLNVQLQDARQATVLRSMRFDLTVQEAFDPAQPLGNRIAEEVGLTLFQHAVQESKYRPFPELANYSLLMGAVGLMHRAALREFDRAREMLEHLLRRQGCGGVAAAWLAKWHVLRVVQGWSLDPSTDARLALEYVAQSLEDDSRDALALSIGGLVHAYLRKDLHTAGHFYEQAIDANPSEPLAWLFSATRHAYLGEGADAEAAGERALRLSPIDPLKYFFDSLAATAALANASWDRSIALSQRSLKANRSHASTWRTLAIALVMLNRMDEARAAVQRLLAIEPGLTLGRFRERFPGRDGPLAEPFADALKAAGVPD